MRHTDKHRHASTCVCLVAILKPAKPCVLLVNLIFNFSFRFWNVRQRGKCCWGHFECTLCRCMLLMDQLFAIIHQNYFSTCDSIEKFFQDAHVDLQITCKTVLWKIFGWLKDEPNNDAFAVFFSPEAKERSHKWSRCHPFENWCNSAIYKSQWRHPLDFLR